MVHSEVYDLTDQALYRFDNRDHRAERSTQIINTKNALSAQTLLDALQVFQRERIGQSVLDIAANLFRFNRKLVEQLQSLITEQLIHDVLHIGKVISQQADHRDHRTQTGDHRAECGHKARKDVEAAFQDGRCHGFTQSERLAAEVRHAGQSLANFRLARNALDLRPRFAAALRDGACRHARDHAVQLRTGGNVQSVQEIHATLCNAAFDPAGNIGQECTNIRRHPGQLLSGSRLRKNASDCRE